VDSRLPERLVPSGGADGRMNSVKIENALTNHG
jgi:hypothetical protein